MSILKEFGIMRIGLLLVSLLCIIFRPGTDPDTELSGLGLITGTIIPVIAPMVFMVLLLDFIMARIFLSDAKVNNPELVTRFQRISWVNLIMAAAIFLSWLPFFLSLRG